MSEDKARRVAEALNSAGLLAEVSHADDSSVIVYHGNHGGGIDVDVVAFIAALLDERDALIKSCECDLNPDMGGECEKHYTFRTITALDKDVIALRAELAAAKAEVERLRGKGEYVWRMVAPEPIEETSERVYTAWPDLWPTWYRRIKGVFVPLEGE